MQKISVAIKVVVLVGVIALLGVLSYFQWFQNVNKKPTEITTENKQPPETNRKEVLYFGYTNTNSNSNEDNGLEVRLKKMDLSTRVSTELLFFSGAKGNVYPASNYTFHRQTFYFVDKDGQLRSVDKNFTGTSLVGVPLEKGQFISDYMIQDDVVYYLAGPFCAVYEGVCNNTLRSMSVKTGTTSTLLKGIKESSIAGFSGDGNSIILSWRIADAGCGRSSFSIISLIKKSVTRNDSFGWCSDELETEGELKKYAEFVKNIHPNASTTRYISTGSELQFNEDDKKVIDLITSTEEKGYSNFFLGTIRSY